MRPLLAAGVLVATLIVCAALEYALAKVYSADTDSLAQIVYRLLPIPVGIVIVRWLLRPAKLASTEPQPPAPLRESPVEQVLDVPTRRGVLAVRACDIEYVKAAGTMSS